MDPRLLCPWGFTSLLYFYIFTSLFIYQFTIYLLVWYIFLDSTFKCYHIVFVFLLLISLSIILFKSIHLPTNRKMSFFLGLISISIVLIYTHIHPIFLIHSPVDGHLGCFCTLTTVNNATINIGIRVSFKISILFCFAFLAICTGVELLGHMVVFFMRPPYCFPQWQHQFTTSPTKGSLFSTSSAFVFFLKTVILTGE